MSAKRELLEHQSKTGGKRQRTKALEGLELMDREEAGEVTHPERFDSTNGKDLVKAWSWGDKPAAEVQRAANLAYTDEQYLLRRLKCHPDKGSQMIKALASIGNWGKQMQHANNNLQTYIGEPNMPKEHMFQVTARVIKRPRRVLAPLARYGVCAILLPFMLPHVWLHHMYANAPDTFAETILSPGVRPRDFWTEVAKRKDPRLQHHPLMEKEGGLTKPYPCPFTETAWRL